MSKVFAEILERYLLLFEDHKFITHTKDQIYMSAIYDDGIAKSNMHVVAQILPYGRVFLGGDIVNAAFGFSSRHPRQPSIDEAVFYFSSMDASDLYRKLQTSIPAEARVHLRKYDHRVMAEDIQWYINNGEYTTDDQRKKLQELLGQVKDLGGADSVMKMRDIVGGEFHEPDGHRPPDFIFMASAVFKAMYRRVLDGQ